MDETKKSGLGVPPVVGFEEREAAPCDAVDYCKRMYAKGGGILEYRRAITASIAKRYGPGPAAERVNSELPLCQMERVKAEHERYTRCLQVELQDAFARLDGLSRKFLDDVNAELHSVACAERPLLGLDALTASSEEAKPEPTTGSELMVRETAGKPLTMARIYEAVEQSLRNARREVTPSGAKTCACGTSDKPGSHDFSVCRLDPGDEPVPCMTHVGDQRLAYAYRYASADQPGLPCPVPGCPVGVAGRAYITLSGEMAWVPPSEPVSPDVRTVVLERLAEWPGGNAAIVWRWAPEAEVRERQERAAREHGAVSDG